MSIAVTVDELLREFVASPTNDAAQRDVATRFQALPLYADIGGCIALRPNGIWVLLEWRTDETGPEPDARWRLIALVSGVRKYPSLKPLLPERRADQPACADCGGSGEASIAGLRGQRCGRCVGLGWVADALRP